MTLNGGWGWFLSHFLGFFVTFILCFYLHNIGITSDKSLKREELFIAHPYFNLLKHKGFQCFKQESTGIVSNVTYLIGLINIYLMNLVFTSLIWRKSSINLCVCAVSYTHLDVYKRQGFDWPGHS